MKRIKGLSLLVLLLSMVMAGCNNPTGGNGDDPPSAPGTPAVSPGDNKLTVSWSAVADADAYQLWYHTANNSAAATQSGGDVSGTSHTVTGLNNSTTYYVWVKAKNSAGTSGFSPSASGIPVAFVASTSGTANQVGYTQIFTRDSLVFKLKYCPGGTFPKGALAKTEPAFWIGETEVTYELWNVVYTWATANGYNFANAGTRGDGTGDTDQHPVTTINWRDAMVWCNALSEKAGLSPVYKNGGSVVKDSGDANAAQCDAVTVDTSADGFQLPGSMQWECAARYRGSDSTNALESPASSGIYWTNEDSASAATAAYTDAPATGAVAWYDANSSSSTQVVKGKTANTLGAYDMSGNVVEWCFELHPTVTSERVGRGGGWAIGSSALQVGDVGSGAPADESFINGFRLAKKVE